MAAAAFHGQDAPGPARRFKSGSGQAPERGDFGRTGGMQGIARIAGLGMAGPDIRTP